MTQKMMSPGQVRELGAKLIRLTPEFDFDTAQAIVDANDEASLVAVRAYLAGLADLPAIFPAVPADGVIFELTFNGDDPAADPLAMVRADGYTGEWQFPDDQPRVRGKQTRRFKLVRAGYCPSLAAIRAKVGPLAEGQWREAFRRRFHRPDGNGPVGFGGSEWVEDLRDERNFPYLREDGGRWNSGFSFAVRSLGEHWRWLVPADGPWLIGGSE